MILEKFIKDAIDTIAMVSCYGGDAQGQFIVELQRIQYGLGLKENEAEFYKSKIIDGLKRIYDIEIQ